jgi:DNA polymerase III delta prime subunit
MKKLSIKIKDLFAYLQIDNTQYEIVQHVTNNIYVQTPTGELTPILGYVKKCNNKIINITLENKTSFKCSENHIVIDNGNQVVAKYATAVLTLDGDQQIINREFVKYGDVYDISIGDPHLYVTPNNVIHHNTSLAKILVHDVLKCNYLYINASDENGIDTIRNKVSNFSQTKSFDGKVKVVILDEADGITAGGQQALRNLMESYSDYTRFILTANYKHKIITPLQSRCQSINLKPSIEQAVKRCVSILKQENIDLEDDQKKNFVDLIKNHFPDLRKTINELQKSVINGKLTIKHTQIDNAFIENIFNHVASKNTLNVRKVYIAGESVFQNDYTSLMKQLLEHVYITDLPDLKKKEMIAVIADHLYRAVFVVDHEINFFACLLTCEKVIS